MQVAKSFFLVLIVAFSVGCVSGVRSTGTSLPQSETLFDDGQLQAEVSHVCDGLRCSEMEVEFTNLTNEPLVVSPVASRITRAGESFPLIPNKERAVNLVIPPKKTVEVSFSPFSADQKHRMTYVKAEGVWCSLKVDPECKDPSRGETMCAAFARYYYQSYLSAGGWIGLEFAYKTPWKEERLKTVSPAPVGVEPAIQLASETNAPSWRSDGGSSVFYKIECDAKCGCKELTPRRNFFTDDKFQIAK